MARSGLSESQSSTAHGSPGSDSPPPSGLLPPQVCTVGSQTVESALVPCEACARVQAALKESAVALASLSKTLGLPCSLWRLLEVVDETLQLGRLSACDVALWACEQKKDLGRIQQHVTQVKENLDSVRERLKEVEEERESIKEELLREQERRRREEEESKRLREELKREQERSRREEQERRRREEEERERLREELKQERERSRRKEEEWRIQAEQELRRQREELKQGAEAFELKISELKVALKLQRENQQQLERERESLQEDVHTLRLQVEKKKDMEMELSNTKNLLGKEKNKNQSLQRHQQAVQVKQRALLDRVDSLVQRCEELEARLDECEEERAELTNTLTHTKEERETLQQRLTQQEAQCVSLNEDRETKCVKLRELEECVSHLKEELHKATERERILVAFPQLSPQNTAPQSTGDVLTDMEQQVKANTIRILVLEQENASLTNSLTKLKHTRSHTHTPESTGVTTGRPDSGTSVKDMNKGVKGASVLHQQTLHLPINPDTAQTYGRTRRAAIPHTRCSGSNRRRR